MYILIFLLYCTDICVFLSVFFTCIFNYVCFFFQMFYVKKNASHSEYHKLNVKTHQPYHKLSRKVYFNGEYRNRTSIMTNNK